MRYEQYCGAQIFKDIVSSQKYRMMFMGTSQRTQDGLKNTIKVWNPDVLAMTFYELPFCNVNEFDYEDIARRVEESEADIIRVALGAPKQVEWVYRIMRSPKKQLKRCSMIILTLPRLLIGEWRRKNG